MNIKFTPKTIYLNETPFFLYSGEYQYFRCPEKEWNNDIEKFKSLGINAVSTYIPWSWHEYDDLKFDFNGETDPKRNLNRFLNLCQKAKLMVTIRPGPYIYAEYHTHGYGIPNWLRKKHPEMLMVRKDGTKDTEVTYLHPTFLKYVKRWFAHLVPVISDFKNILAIQIDNETNGVYGRWIDDFDYNPDTIKKYRDWLNDRYRDFVRVKELYNLKSSSFSEVSPPTKIPNNIKDVRQWLDWCEFKEKYIIQYLNSLKELLINLGLKNVVYIHNDAAPLTPVNLFLKSKLAILCIDVYPKFLSNSTSFFDLPFTPVTMVKLFQAIQNAPLLAMELETGYFNPNVRLTSKHTLQLATLLLAHGVSGINHYVLRDGVNPDGTRFWYHAPLDVAGKQSETFQAIKTLGKFINQHGSKLLETVEIQSPVAFAYYQPYLRPIGGIGGGLVPSVLSTLTSSGLIGAMLESGYNPQIVDIAHSSLENLQALFIINPDFIEEEIGNKLVHYVKNGGTLISLPFALRWNYSFSEETEVFKTLFQAKYKGIKGFTSSKILPASQIIKLELKRFLVESFMKNKKMLTEGFTQRMKILLNLTKTFGKLKFNLNKPMRVKGSWHTTIWDVKGTACQPILWYNNQVAGFKVKYGTGNAILIGSLIGPWYDSPFYYEENFREKNELSNFLDALMTEANVPKIFETTPPTECVWRRSETGSYHYFFIFNRGKRKKIRLKIINPKILGLDENEEYIVYDALDKNENIKMDIHDLTDFEIDISDNSEKIFYVKRNK